MTNKLHQTDLKKELSARNKASVKRAHVKETTREEIFKRKEIDHLKKIEQTKLRTYDIRENQQF